MCREPWRDMEQPSNRFEEALIRAHNWGRGPAFTLPRTIVFWISTTLYICGAIGVAMIFAAVVGR